MSADVGNWYTGDNMNKRELIKLGMDVDGALERLGGNENLLERLLEKFLADPNYGELREALETKDTGKAFAASHTLKGVCISLSLSRLYEPVSEMTEYLRVADLESARKQLPIVTSEYERLIAGLGNCLEHS